MHLKLENYHIAIIILIISLSYLFFVDYQASNYRPVGLLSVQTLEDGTKVSVSGVTGKLVDNGFYLCASENQARQGTDCVKINVRSARSDVIIYQGDNVTVSGTVASYMGHKFIRAEKIQVNQIK